MSQQSELEENIFPDYFQYDLYDSNVIPSSVLADGLKCH